MSGRLLQILRAGFGTSPPTRRRGRLPRRLGREVGHAAAPPGAACSTPAGPPADLAPAPLTTPSPPHPHPQPSLTPHPPITIRNGTWNSPRPRVRCRIRGGGGEQGSGPGHSQRGHRPQPTTQGTSHEHTPPVPPPPRAIQRSRQGPAESANRQSAGEAGEVGGAGGVGMVCGGPGWRKRVKAGGMQGCRNRGVGAALCRRERQGGSRATPLAGEDPIPASGGK